MASARRRSSHGNGYSSHGLVQDDTFQISLTEKGKLVYDLVLLAFYPESVRGHIHERQGTGHATA